MSAKSLCSVLARSDECSFSRTVVSAPPNYLASPSPLQRTRRRLKCVTTSADLESLDQIFHETLPWTRDELRKGLERFKLPILSPTGRQENAQPVLCIDDRDEKEEMDGSHVRPLDPNTFRDSETRRVCAEAGPDLFAEPIALPMVKSLSVPNKRPAQLSLVSGARSIDGKSVLLDADLLALLEYIEEAESNEESVSKGPTGNMLVIDNEDLVYRGLRVAMSSMSSSQGMEDEESSADASTCKDLGSKTSHKQRFRTEDIIMPSVMPKETKTASSPSLPFDVSETLDDSMQQVQSQRSTKSYSTEPSANHEKITRNLNCVSAVSDAVSDLHNGLVEHHSKPSQSNIKKSATSESNKNIAEQDTQPSISENNADLTLLGKISVPTLQRYPSDNLEKTLIRCTSTISTAETTGTEEETDQPLSRLASLSTISSSLFRDDSFISATCSYETEKSCEKSKNSKASNDTSRSDVDKANLFSYSLAGSTSASIGESNEWNNLLEDISKNIFVSPPKPYTEENTSTIDDPPDGRNYVVEGYESVCVALLNFSKVVCGPSKESAVMFSPMDCVVPTTKVPGNCVKELTKIDMPKDYNGLDKVDGFCTLGGEQTSLVDGSRNHNPADEESPAKVTPAAESARMTISVETTQPDTKVSDNPEAKIDDKDCLKLFGLCSSCNEIVKLCMPDTRDPTFLCNDSVNQALNRSTKKDFWDITGPTLSSLSRNSLSARPMGFGELPVRREKADSVPTLITSSKLVRKESTAGRPPLLPSSHNSSGHWTRIFGRRRNFPSLRRSKSKARSLGSRAETM